MIQNLWLLALSVVDLVRRLVSWSWWWPWLRNCDSKTVLCFLRRKIGERTQRSNDKMTEWLCHSFWTFYCTNQYDDHNPWWSNSRQSSVARRCLCLLNDDFNKSFSVNTDRLHVNHRNRPPIAYTSSVNSRIFCGSWFLTFLSDSIWLLDGLSNRDLMSAIFLRVTSVQNFKSNSSR